MCSNENRLNLQCAMTLDTLITFAIGGSLGGSVSDVKISGRASDSPSAWKAGWYSLLPNDLYVDGSITSISQSLVWTTNVHGWAGGTTVQVDSSWYFIGTKQNETTGEFALHFEIGFGNIPYTFPEGFDYYGAINCFTLRGGNPMAGLLTKITYTSDTGNTYVLVMDKSNAAAIGNAEAPAGSVVSLPGNLTPRYILLQQSDNPRIRRKIIAGTQGLSRYKDGGTVSLETVAGAKDFTVTGRVGEKYTF